jgi:hypothetical protein
MSFLHYIIWSSDVKSQSGYLCDDCAFPEWQMRTIVTKKQGHKQTKCKTHI